VPYVNNRPPLRAALDRLTQTFVEGVLRALQSASLAEIQELGFQEAGRTRAAATPARTASRAPLPARERGARPPANEARPRVRASRSAASRTNEWRSIPDHEENDPHLAMTITDPAAVLAMVEEVIRNTPAIAAAVASAAADEQEPPRPEPPAAVPASRVELRPAARPGEEVLRAAGGGLVLRRRRPQTTAQRS
jgi:hypothetical protein